MQIFRSQAVPRSQERMLREAFRLKRPAEHSDFISINVIDFCLICYYVFFCCCCFFVVFCFKRRSFHR